MSAQYGTVPTDTAIKIALAMMDLQADHTIEGTVQEINDAAAEMFPDLPAPFRFVGDELQVERSFAAALEELMSGE